VFYSNCSVFEILDFKRAVTLKTGFHSNDGPMSYHFRDRRRFQSSSGHGISVSNMSNHTTPEVCLAGVCYEYCTTAHICMLSLQSLHTEKNNNLLFSVQSTEQCWV